MSVQAITTALALQGVTATEKLLLFVLANYADETMRCWPSMRRLALDTAMSERTVQRTLKVLEDRGFVSRVARVRSDGSRSTDIITLNLSGGDIVTGGGVTMSPGGVNDDLEVVTACQGGGVTVSPLTTFEPPLEPSIEPKTPAAARAKTYPPGFEIVWKTYPHTPGRSSKPEAVKLWSKLPPDEQTALPGAIRQFADKVETVCGGKGAPDMAVWLRQGKHLSWIEAEQARPAIVRFAGPEDVRQAIVTAKGEGWTRAYIDPCGWDDGGRRLIPRNGVALTALRSEVGAVLAARRVTVEMAA